MPTTATPAAASCTTSPAADEASRSSNRNAPITTPEIGSTVSMIGRLADSALAW
jgi:hypothetical protein